MSGFLCALPVIAGLLSACDGPVPLATGYVEGEYVMVAPVSTAQIAGLTVARGDRVARDAVLVEMERRDAEIALAEAEARLAEAESQLANLREGRREAEVNVIAAALASAKAQEVEAAKSAERLQSLFDRGITPEAQRDDAGTALDVARARVAEMEANLAVARLPARPHEINAAEAAVTQAQSRRDNAAWLLEKRTLTAPAGGTVFEVLRREGEIAGPQAPVLSLLPDGAVLLRLYVAEPLVAGIAPGTRLSVNCDGCPAGQSATVSYVADSPEFTPPVIYSLENRQKLVYLVEARPDPGSEALKPGQIVDVVVAAP